MNQIHNWLNTGLIVIVGVLVLVGGNQSAPIGDLGRVGTEFQHGIRTRWIESPDTETSSVTSFSIQRRCPIASESANCTIQNFSGVNWIVQQSLVVDGTATNTKFQLAVSTSTVAYAGAQLTSGWVASSTLLKWTFSTSTVGFQLPSVIYGTTTDDSSASGANSRYIMVRPNEILNCTAVRVKKAGDVGFLETSTSTNFTFSPACHYEIVATSTPDSTPTR